MKRKFFPNAITADNNLFIEKLFIEVLTHDLPFYRNEIMCKRKNKQLIGQYSQSKKRHHSINPLKHSEILQSHLNVKYSILKK